MAADGVGRQTKELDAALGELGLEAGELAELGGADRGVVLGVGEEDEPLVADELVEVDRAASGLSLEVGGNGAQTKTLRCLLAPLFTKRRATASPPTLALAPGSFEEWPRIGGDLRSDALIGHCDDVVS